MRRTASFECCPKRGKTSVGRLKLLAISIIRTFILYFVIVISMRIMGKRQLGELEPVEFVVAVLISDLATNPLQDIGTPLLYGLMPVIILVCCEVLISGAMLKSIGFRSLVCGRPSMIIENGVIIQKEMKKNRFSTDELTEQLRKKNVPDISSVKFAVLETDGTLSVILFSDESPVTPKQLNIQTEKNEYPVIVINDGQIMERNLKGLGFNEKWLKKQLDMNKLKSHREVFLMSADKTGKIYLARKDTL